MGEISDRLSIRPGDTVTIVNRFGQKRKGRAVMFNPKYGCWVLNGGGAHGTPLIADETNIVAIKRPRRKE